MKKNIYVIIVSIALASACGCSDFGAINENPNALAVPTPAFLFSKAQLSALSNEYYFAAILNIGGFIQHYATYKEVSGVGDKYFLNDFYQGSFFTNGYATAASEIEEVIRSLKAPEDANKLNIARIWRVFVYHRITDIYGDVPYSEAGKGFSNFNFTPVYDTQESIYKDMLKELEEAAVAMDPSLSSFDKSDFIYEGDISKWKKFAYSLMLRLGIRLTKVDATLAETWVKKAIAGGVILDYADNAIMKYSDGPSDINRNPTAREARSRDYTPTSFGRANTEGGKLSETFINALKNSSDPRLPLYSIVWVNKNADTTPSIQKGFPNGTDLVPSPDEQATYSEPNQNTVFRLDAPLMVLGNAEANLYLAEAALRGWATGATASQYYENGVRASLENAAIYGAAYAIPASRIDAYLSAHPYEASVSMEKQMEQIHTQIWIALFMDEYEIFSNWRRTGYPKLTPVNFSGNATGGVIPRRFPYPNAEVTSNSANLNKALERQGPNTLTSRVWWDKNP